VLPGAASCCLLLSTAAAAACRVNLALARTSACICTRVLCYVSTVSHAGILVPFPVGSTHGVGREWTPTVTIILAGLLATAAPACCLTGS
jgi:hypothetical protein